MKSYLDLVPISAKVHRKQNRMSIICIVLAVFLVTAIFGMADMFIRGQILHSRKTEIGILAYKTLVMKMQCLYLPDQR